MVIEIVFNDSAEAELFKAAMVDTQQALAHSYKELILSTTDVDKKNYVLNKAEQVESIDIDALFRINEDGAYTYTVPYPSVEIVADNQVFFADENGMLSLDESAKGTEAVIAHEGFAIDVGELNIEEKSDGSSLIKVTRTVEELADGMLRMGESMAMEGQGNVYRAKMNVGATWAPNTGHGTSEIIYSTTAKPNIVGCNKLHKSYTENITPAGLLFGGSDCGKSIRLGLLPFGYSWSDYCKDESLNGQDGSTAGRRFCTNNTGAYTTDGVYKQGHYNCSWFPSVCGENAASEQGHTHT